MENRAIEKKQNISNIHQEKNLDRLAWVLTLKKETKKEKQAVIHTEAALRKERASFLWEKACRLQG